MLTFISLSRFVEKFKTRKTRTRRQHAQKFNLPMETLESRVLPAATIVGLPGAGDTRTFVDDDGDTVTVRVSGTTGTATFTDSEVVPGAVTNGDDIGKVVITGASSDFTLTYSFDADGAGADTVLMGDITSSRTIKGVFSVPLNNGGAPIGSFTLGSFIGPGFSLHGGLSADDLVGRTADDVGIDINALEANRNINFRGNVDGDVRIRGALNGTIAFGNGVAVGSAWTIGTTVGSAGGIGGSGDFLGTATFNGIFSGSATIDGDVDGNWTFKSSVPASAKLLADDWQDVNALRNFGGQILSDGEITLDVGGSITGTANLTAEDDINLNVIGSINSGARISTSSDIEATVGGNVSGIFTASGDLTLDVGGSLVGAKLTIGNDADLTIDRGILNTSATIGSDLTIDVTGGITDSVLNAGSPMTIDVTGSVTRSQLNSTTGDATVDISGNLVDSQVNSGSSDLTLNVLGNIVNSKVMSDESGISVTVGGSVSRSMFTAGDSEIELTVGGNISYSTIVGTSSDVSVTVTGSITNTTILCPDATVTLDVGGNVANSSISGSGMDFDITGSLINTKVTGDEDSMSISVGLDVTGSTLTVLDEALTLEVGRDLIGTAISVDTDVSIDVTRHMTRSSVSSASSDITLDVGGNMTSSSAASAESDITATVGGNFTNSNLTSDEDITLAVTGNASGTLTTYDSDITLTVGGSFTGKAIANENLIVKVGSLNASLTSGDTLDLLVTGNVSAASVIQTISVDDLGDADTIGFRVGGTFAGTLTAVFLDSDEGDGVNDLVLGNVLSTAKFNIGLFDGDADEVYRFGGSFAGHLAIAQTVNVDLVFNGNVHSIAIGGSVGVTDGTVADAVNTITINGRLTFLSSNSLFVPTGAGDGDFEDGAGVLTGNLITTGFTTVIPLA